MVCWSFLSGGNVQILALVCVGVASAVHEVPNRAKLTGWPMNQMFENTKRPNQPCSFRKTLEIDPMQQKKDLR